MSNLLVDIANEDDKAYCVSPSVVQIAVNRGVSKGDICTAIVDIVAGNTGAFYMEDRGCCAFVAMDYQKDEEADNQ